MNDDELVERARDGDSEAVSDLLRRHHARIHSVCFRILGRRADADDAAQNALIAIVRGLPRFDGRSTFSTWAYRIATNAALDELRRRRRRPRLRLESTDASGRSQEPDQRAERDLLAFENRQIVERALADLPDDFRVAVVLRDVADLDYESIASILDVPIGTVRSRIARGRALLADNVGNRTPLSERHRSSDGETQ